MNKRELEILGKVFAAEVESAFSATGIHLFQTKSKLAVKLMDEGFLRFTSVKFQNVIISGYELTEAGRLAYCVAQ